VSRIPLALALSHEGRGEKVEGGWRSALVHRVAANDSRVSVEGRRRYSFLSS
jgi:hypothetical protein